MELDRVTCCDVMDGLKGMPDGVVQCVVTSPPYYGLRNYLDSDGQIGLETSPLEYVDKLVGVFREIKRVLRDDGVVWLNIGDSYASVKSRYSSRSHTLSGKDRGDNHNRKPDLYHCAKEIGIKDKDLLGIPWRVAFGLQDDGWYLRSAIVWAKGVSFCDSYRGAVMPESVMDRPTSAYEMIFLLSKNKKYFYDKFGAMETQAEESIKRVKNSWNGNNKRDYIKGDQNNISGYFEKFKGKTEEEIEQEMGGKNARNVWCIQTKGFDGDHYATFPEDLPLKCILLGTSEKGCCVKCGMPWKRVLKKVGISKSGGKRKRADAPGAEVGDNSAFATGEWNNYGTEGWVAGCECGNVGTKPCLVMDPFAGAGTTLLVAVKEGRQAVGFEINQKYVDMANKRIELGTRQGRFDFL